MSNGKGDTPRPILDKKRYDANWDRIFGDGDKKEVEKQSYKVTLTKELAEYAEQIADITLDKEPHKIVS